MEKGILATLLLAAFVVFIIAMPKAKIQLYWQRRCTGRAWRRSFPAASKGEIRAFLRLFVDAFAFSPNRMLQFAPEDKVLAVYRALYPVKDWPDALEVETLADRLYRTYGIELAGIWSDQLTLGEIFRQTRG
jgi:hypothetical protein